MGIGRRIRQERDIRSGHGTAPKLGRAWQDDELDAIVADYFEMLEADLAGRPYVKLQHSRELMSRIGRTHRSVEPTSMRSTVI